MRWASTSPSGRDIAWIAGFFEGEGSFNEGHIQIPQKDPEMLYRVQELVGGKVGGLYLTQASNGLVPMYRWYATGSRARGIAMTIYPFLSRRRREQLRRFLRIEPLRRKQARSFTIVDTEAAENP